MAERDSGFESACIRELLATTSVGERGAWLHVVEAGHARREDERPDVAGFESLARKPGIALVLGRCEGFDLELTLAATLVVAARGASFRGGGAAPPRYPGSLHRLRTRLGGGGALAFWLDSRAWSARRAQTRGLVDAVQEDPRERAEAWRELWETQAGAAEKLMLLRRARVGLSESSALALERALFALSFAGEGARDGARGFFE